MSQDHQFLRQIFAPLCFVTEQLESTGGFPNQSAESAVAPFCARFLQHPSTMAAQANDTTALVWLVVSKPLKHMKVNWDDEIPNIWKNKIHVPNHQSVVYCTRDHGSNQSSQRFDDRMSLHGARLR